MQHGALHTFIKNHFPFIGKRTLPRPEGRLQQRAQSRDEEYGGDELTFGHVVVLDAERLGQDERDGDDATKRQDVMLGKHKGTLQEEGLFSHTPTLSFFTFDRFQLLLQD